MTATKTSTWIGKRKINKYEAAMIAMTTALLLGISVAANAGLAFAPGTN
jgi:hypothetical protein